MSNIFSRAHISSRVRKPYLILNIFAKHGVQGPFHPQHTVSQCTQNIVGPLRPSGPRTAGCPRPHGVGRGLISQSGSGLS